MRGESKEAWPLCNSCLQGLHAEEANRILLRPSWTREHMEEGAMEQAHETEKRSIEYLISGDLEREVGYFG